MLLCGLCLGAAAVAEDDEATDSEFLEYLGMWEESDEEWLLHEEMAEAAAEQRTDPAPEGESRVTLGVHTHRPEDVGVHHAGAPQLDPPRFLAGPASLPGANRAGDAVLATGLDEREMPGSQTRRDVLAEKPHPNGLERSLEIGHRDALVDDQGLELMEHR